MFTAWSEIKYLATKELLPCHYQIVDSRYHRPKQCTGNNLLLVTYCVSYDHSVQHLLYFGIATKGVIGQFKTFCLWTCRNSSISFRDQYCKTRLSLLTIPRDRSIHIQRERACSFETVDKSAGLTSAELGKLLLKTKIVLCFSQMSQLSINPKCSIYRGISMCILRSLCTWQCHISYLMAIFTCDLRRHQNGLLSSAILVQICKGDHHPK